MNEGVNLLEPNKNTGPGNILHHLQVMRIITVFLLFIISVSAVIIFILVSISPLPELKNQEQSLQQTLLQSKSDIVKLSLVKEQTDAINQLITNRQSLDVPLSMIEYYLSSDMTVTDIQTDNKTILLTVESPSLKSLDTFLNGIIGYVQEKKVFSSAILVDLTTDQTDNEYALTVQLGFL
jgi:hypothetical protein